MYIEFQILYFTKINKMKKNDLPPLPHKIVYLEYLYRQTVQGFNILAVIRRHQSILIYYFDYCTIHIYLYTYFMSSNT